MNFTALLIVLGLGLDPTCITAQLNDGGIYDNYSDFEACNDFLAGDQNIEDERWDMTSANAWTVSLSSAR